MDNNLRFLQYCLSGSVSLTPDFLEGMNWHELFLFARKQSLTGICWDGIKRLYDVDADVTNGCRMPNKPTVADVIEWLGAAEAIDRRNKVVSESVVSVSGRFASEGFDTCLLKGQGNALMYPSGKWRVPGDIDLWVSPQGASYCADEEVIAYCRRFLPNAKASYHHIDFVSVGNVPVEVHYRPSWLFNPVHNMRLQRFFADTSAACFSNDNIKGFKVPTWEFNVVFQLSHIYNHLLHEGIGLRQLVDYYYLLKSKPFDGDTEKTIYNINRCGMRRIAMSVTWVLKNVFCMNDEFLLFPADERGGRFLLNEMMEGGNFGHYDNRMMSGTYGNALMRNLQRLVRDARMVRLFPYECVCEPFFRLWHFFWRKKHDKVGKKRQEVR